MSLRERIYSILIVSSSDSFNKAACEMLPSSKYQPVQIVASAAEAKRCIADRNYDFIIINSPLPDESGVRFSIECCQNQSCVVLILVRSELHTEVYEKVAGHGVFTLAKPIARTTMMQALGWLCSARERLRRSEKTALSFEDRMEEIRIVNRAKCLLISELKMTEPEAHHYIERNAMDNCISKKTAAQEIIKIYT